MSTIPFSAEQRRFFHAQCSALNAFCAATGLRPLVMMGNREIFTIYCDGNLTAVIVRRPVNDNQPRP